MSRHAPGSHGRGSPTIGQLADRRSRTIRALSACIVGLYFAFMGAFAFAKPLLGILLAPGLTLGLVLGPALIATACLISLAYVIWADLAFDRALATYLDAQGGLHG